MRRLLYAVALVVAIVASIVSCEDDERYVYTARRFDEANACVGPYVPVERVVGEGADAKCAPTCLTFKDAFYVSPVCPPLPVEATEVPQDDPRCQAAASAFLDDALCDAPQDEDGGADEDAGDEEENDGGEEDAAEET
jgi:hypothetical protein